MNHPFTFIKSRAWLYFVHWSLWMFAVDEMRMKTAFTPFTLDESSAMHIQSVKRKFALSYRRHSSSDYWGTRAPRPRQGGGTNRGDSVETCYQLI